MVGLGSVRLLGLVDVACESDGKNEEDHKEERVDDDNPDNNLAVGLLTRLGNRHGLGGIDGVNRVLEVDEVISGHIERGAGSTERNVKSGADHLIHHILEKSEGGEGMGVHELIGVVGVRRGESGPREGLVLSGHVGGGEAGVLVDVGGLRAIAVGEDTGSAVVDSGKASVSGECALLEGVVSAVVVEIAR